ncbi:MAG: S9 family peptidase [Bacteroidota bacterium]
MSKPTDFAPPTASKIPKELSMHDDVRVDNYYWLNERENPQVIEYLAAENEYTDSVLAPVKDFQNALFLEMKSRIKEDDQSVPYKKNGYYYLYRYEQGKEYPIFSRKKESLAGEEEVMLDVNQLAEGHDFFQIGRRSVSPNNKILAYGQDTVSRRLYTLLFKNLETGEKLEDAIANTTGSAVWANDNLHIFYTLQDPETLRSFKVMRHKLGTSSEEDVEVFHETDNTFSCYVAKSKSDKFINIGSYQTLSTEEWMLAADTPLGEFSLVQPRERDHEYTAYHYGDYFYILTNWEAENFRLMRTSIEETAKENWEEVIPHRVDVLLQGVNIFKDFLVLSERINGITQIRILSWEGGEEHYLDFGEDAFTAYTSTNPEFDTDLLRVGYTSMTTPNTIYDYDMKERKLTLKKQQEVVGEFNPENYQTERLYATARDGVKVPISIVYKKGFKKDGTRPLLLYAYGSYGASMDPYFSSLRLSLLDRGFAYAIAHIRGGQELGRKWYEDGKLLKKKNTFYDFIDCASYLIEEKYTSSAHIYAMGGSAGGLLMGAVVNMEPELWNGVVSSVPFVDVITTMLDESIPLTTGEYDEWGNPNEPEYYEYIKSYSPYDNVVAKNYPSMLVTTGLHDSQVQYWEPAKYVAKLRELKTDDNVLLLHTNMEAGHGGKSGRFESLKEVAMEYVFLFSLEGIKE